MAYKVLFSESARKQFTQLNKDTQKAIIKYLETRVTKDPLLFGKSLTGNKKGLWRYRVKDYRIICNIQHNALVVLVIKVGHGKEIYQL
ncbi:addiction module toxin, RelE/StbE family [Candidatus Phycorickettsia trachydisci]|uniref:Addiction module toxin, RelE/StbE family n=1 Tax=Candidatus Phycorickettsia trachydisci TaxID=2115978 RepID=A0A2P1P9H9_9RICK|nr:type II toxin-antitoxin system RelE/ParE family toxin [Candidatus Phycorickettsia trachydisci]AVP87900.1 addiction module toxin, RelE/StbE family [Candidatus Phycorickettsia trachydisci]